MKKIKLIFASAVFFFLAVAVWYSPVLFKGYNSETTASHSLVRAKNFALTGKYSTENKLNVILAPELIPADGSKSFYGNKLGTILYSYVIKFFKISQNNSAVFANCVILALALVFFSIAVNYLFGFEMAIIFSLVYIFLPSNWLNPQMLVGYEFALLFLSLFILFFSLGSRGFTKEAEEIKKYTWINKFYLVISGIFLILSCLSREAFLLILPILFIFLLFSKLRKIVFYIFIPAVVILCLFWLPSFISGENTYLLFFTNQADEKLKSSDFSYYAHLFPDPYTYHFDQESYLKEQNIGIQDLDLMGQIGMNKVLTNMGVETSGLIDHIKIGTPLFVRHLFRFFSITEIGGPLIFLLVLLGMIILKKQENYWFSYYLSWLLGSLFIMSYVDLAGRNHLMDFGFAIAVCAALGLVVLADSLSKNLYGGKYKRIFTIMMAGLVIYSLVLADHVMWGKEYDNSTVPLVLNYADRVKEKNISSQDVVALPLTANDAYNLNFNTEKSFVVFGKDTVSKLLLQNKLKEAFDKFGVKYILGYSPELSAQIASSTGAVIIADSMIQTDNQDLEMNNKMWFLNLVK